MSIINPQSKELSGLVEIKVATAASYSLLGHNDPFYAPEEQIARLSKIAGRGITPTGYTNLSWMTDSGFMFPEFLKNQGQQCKNGVYQTMVKNIFIIMDEDLLVDVGGLGRFDHPYGYFEEKLLSAFEPDYLKCFRNSKRKGEFLNTHKPNSPRAQNEGEIKQSRLKADLKILKTGRINIQHDQDSDSRKQDWQPFANGGKSRLGEIGFA
ncbi:hypothetical protein Lal_00008029 [Lupinus albus]|nr:hypothetical protein Lal_00008029 [Lupinus albus]